MHPSRSDHIAWPLAVICILALLTPASRLKAETVILKSGEKFVTSKVWQEGSAVKFSMHGIIVSVPQADIDRIIPSSPPSADNQPAPARAGQAGRRPAQQVLKDPGSKPDGKKRKPLLKKETSRPAPYKSHRIDRLPFANLRWAVRPRALGPLVRLKTEKMYDGIVQYAWKDKSPAWGKIELEGLAFGFWHNRLYSITMWVYGMPRFKRLRQAVFANYGRAKPVNKGAEKYIWSSRQTDALLEFDRRLNTGIFWMRSRLLDQQAKRLYPTP